MSTMTTTLRKPEDARRTLAEAYAPILPELAEADRIYNAELASRSAYVARLVEHCSELQGKRLRPALLLLTAQACGGIRPEHPTLAAVVEMIHTATLVHDDILDEALVRRHAATVNAEWGNESAVLIGDYLFTHAFHLAASLETTLACRLIGRATNLVCEGEMQQVSNRGNLVLGEDAYFSIIRGKTAELTAVSCRLGAHYAGASPQVVEAMDRYGRDLGVAFQIADDVLDLLGEERTTGKTLGTDLEKQKLTLPVIRLLATMPPHDADRLRDRLSHPEADSRPILRPLLESFGALEYAWDRAQEFADSSRAALDSLPASRTREILTQLTYYVVRRAY
jgi:octaprenyl-diphosphate synthase